MQDLGQNFIAGEWVEGVSTVENRNPSDLGDLVGLFAQASSEQLDATLDEAQLAQRGMGHLRDGAQTGCSDGHRYRTDGPC